MVDTHRVWDSSSSSGKYMGFGLRVRTGTEMTTIIDDRRCLQHNTESTKHRYSPQRKRRAAMERRIEKEEAGGCRTSQIYLSGLLHIRCFSYTVYILSTTTIYAPDRTIKATQKYCYIT